MTSRHRGAKPLRRYELLGAISLLSPEYLLSFERWPFHAEPPDHYALVSNLIDVSVSQQAPLCHCTLQTITKRLEGTLRTSVTLLEATTPVKLPTMQCLPNGIRPQITKGSYFNDGYSTPDDAASKPPTILHICYPKSMQSCSKGSRGLSVPLRVSASSPELQFHRAHG